jgi:hypothetical protein
LVYNNPQVKKFILLFEFYVSHLIIRPLYAIL